MQKKESTINAPITHYPPKLASDQSNNQPQAHYIPPPLPKPRHNLPTASGQSKQGYRITNPTTPPHTPTYFPDQLPASAKSNKNAIISQVVLSLEFFH